VEREAAGTRKGAGGCAHPCARLIYRRANVCARAYAASLHGAHVRAGVHRGACVHICACVCVCVCGEWGRETRRRIGATEGWCRRTHTRGWTAPREVSREISRRAARECRLGGVLGLRVPVCFVRVSFVGVTARWKLNDACRRRQTSIH